MREICSSQVLKKDFGELSASSSSEGEARLFLFLCCFYYYLKKKKNACELVHVSYTYVSFFVLFFAFFYLIFFLFVEQRNNEENLEYIVAYRE